MRVILFFISSVVCYFLTAGDLLDSNFHNRSINDYQNTTQSTRPYTSDKNPVTWDEEPSNLPLTTPTTYQNTDNIEVQAPTRYHAIPPGACATCRNGSYSFIKNRRGTCSRHGGVAEWLKLNN